MQVCTFGGTHFAIPFLSWKSASTSHPKAPRPLFTSPAVSPESQSQSSEKHVIRSRVSFYWTSQTYCSPTMRESTSSGSCARREQRFAGLHRLFSSFWMMVGEETASEEREESYGDCGEGKIMNIIRKFEGDGDFDCLARINLL